VCIIVVYIYIYMCVCVFLNSVPLTLCISLCVFYAFGSFCKVCIFIVKFIYSYFYACSVYSVSLCCSMCSFCVNVHCTVATGRQHSCS